MTDKIIFDEITKVRNDAKEISDNLDNMYWEAKKAKPDSKAKIIKSFLYVSKNTQKTIAKVDEILDMIYRSDIPASKAEQLVFDVENYKFALLGRATMVEDFIDDIAKEVK